MPLNKSKTATQKQSRMGAQNSTKHNNATTFSEWQQEDQSEKNGKAKRKLEFECVALLNKKPRFVPNQVIVISEDEEHNFEADHSPTIHIYPVVISDTESEMTSETIQDGDLARLDKVIFIIDDENDEEHDVIIIIDDEYWYYLIKLYSPAKFSSPF